METQGALGALEAVAAVEVVGNWEQWSLGSQLTLKVLGTLGVPSLLVSIKVELSGGRR